MRAPQLLVVDDEAETRRLLRTVFEEAGYRAAGSVDRTGGARGRRRGLAAAEELAGQAEELRELVARYRVPEGGWGAGVTPVSDADVDSESAELEALTV